MLAMRLPLSMLNLCSLAYECYPASASAHKIQGIGAGFGVLNEVIEVVAYSSLNITFLLEQKQDLHVVVLFLN
jgi:hypothetical protein